MEQKIQGISATTFLNFHIEFEPELVTVFVRIICMVGWKQKLPERLIEVEYHLTEFNHTRMVEGD